MKTYYFSRPIYIFAVIVIIIISSCTQDDLVPISQNQNTVNELKSATPVSLTVKPDRLSFSPGNTITFKGKVTDALGSGVYGVQIGVDDPVKQFCTLSPKTDLNGNFTYTSVIPSTCKGVYAFSFLLGNLKYYVAVNVTTSIGLKATNSYHKITLGPSTSISTYNVASMIKIPSTYGFKISTYDQLKQDVTKIADFSISVLGNSLADYVSNPVNDIVTLAALACIVSSPTVITQVPCSAAYAYVVKAAAKSSVVGLANTMIDKSSMSSTNKTYWKNQVAVGKCVVGLITLDPKSVVSEFSTGWTCGSVTYKAFSSPRKSLELVGTPTSTSKNDDAIGIFLINK